MTEAILFDSDGVLVDTERLFFEATRAAFQSVGVTLPADLWSVRFLSEGRRSREIGVELGIPAEQIESTMELRDLLFWKRVDQGVPLMSGILETLEQLAPRYRLAVVTGATRPHFERVHRNTELLRYFTVTVTGDECEHVKPHPEAYHLALQRLGLPPEACIAVEDSPRGAKAARAAGIRCFVIPTPLTDIAQCPADAIVCSTAIDLLRDIQA